MSAVVTDDTGGMPLTTNDTIDKTPNASILFTMRKDPLKFLVVLT